MDATYPQGDLTDEEADAILNKDIIEILGLNKLEPERQEALRQKMLKTIENRTYSHIYDVLTAQGKWDEYEKMTDDDQKTALLSQCGLNEETLFLQESLLYKLEMIEIAKLAKGGVLPTATK